MGSSTGFVYRDPKFREWLGPQRHYASDASPDAWFMMPYVPRPWTAAGQEAQALGALFDPNDPAFQRLIREAMPYYQREIRKARPWLYAQGRSAGRKAVDVVLRKAGLKPPPIRKEKPAPPWVRQLTQPVLTPFIAGVRKEVEPVVRKAGWQLGGSVVAVAGLGLFFSFMIGYFVGLPSNR
jgi:hypothetical protein